jgi:hypothetical protein
MRDVDEGHVHSEEGMCPEEEEEASQRREAPSCTHLKDNLSLSINTMSFNTDNVQACAELGSDSAALPLSFGCGVFSVLAFNKGGDIAQASSKAYSYAKYQDSKAYSYAQTVQPETVLSTKTVQPETVQPGGLSSEGEGDERVNECQAVLYSQEALEPRAAYNPYSLVVLRRRGRGLCDITRRWRCIKAFNWFALATYHAAHYSCVLQVAGTMGRECVLRWAWDRVYQETLGEARAEEESTNLGLLTYTAAVCWIAPALKDALVTLFFIFAMHL